jgi:hypothetical protein
MAVLFQRVVYYHTNYPFPCLKERKKDFPPEIKQRHPAQAECRLFVCFPILPDRFRFRRFSQITVLPPPAKGRPLLTFSVTYKLLTARS